MAGRRTQALLAGVLAAMLTGCAPQRLPTAAPPTGSVAPATTDRKDVFRIEGMVSLFDQPLSDAEVICYRLDQAMGALSPQAVATDESGRFTITTHSPLPAGSMISLIARRGQLELSGVVPVGMADQATDDQVIETTVNLESTVVAKTTAPWLTPWFMHDARANADGSIGQRLEAWQAQVRRTLARPDSGLKGRLTAVQSSPSWAAIQALTGHLVAQAEPRQTITELVDWVYTSLATLPTNTTTPLTVTTWAFGAVRIEPPQALVAGGTPAREAVFQANRLLRNIDPSPSGSGSRSSGRNDFSSDDDPPVIPGPSDDEDVLSGTIAPL